MNTLNPKIAFFIIRYNGFQYFEEILKFINSEQFHFKVIGIYGVKWKESTRIPKLKILYPHKINDRISFKDIIDRNRNQLIAIICNDLHPLPSTPDTHSDNHNTVTVKRHFRSKYRNIIHVSDNEQLAYNEIQSVLNIEPVDIKRMIINHKSFIGLCDSSSEFIKIFNKIEDGRQVLWKP